MATATSVHHLPPETLGNVISFLPQADLKNLRLVDHRFSPLAARRLFRRTRLLARAKENNDPRRFIQLAKSELNQFEFLPVLWDALPLLARFRNIQTLHLCFDASFTLRDFKSGSNQFRKTTAIPNQCQEIFTQLPLTWLSSTVAANLQVLSLHYQSYWGWFPNIDIRLIGGGNGMPKLRSLSLGHFVFSNQGEVDWMTSLDLEELFLAGCAVLSKHIGHPTTQKGFWTAGRDFFSTAKIGGEMKRTCLWWHEIIWQVRTRMPNLKRFCIVRQPGLSYHFRKFCEVEGLGDSELSSDEESSHKPNLWQQFIDLSGNDLRSCETAFQHFTCATSPRLCLESDAFLCSRSGPSTSFISNLSCYDYVSHNPIYTEQASFKDIKALEAGQVISNVEKLATIEVIILHSMLSKKSKNQHRGAEKLRLAPLMGFHDTNEYATDVLRPLLTSLELSFLRTTLYLSDL
ncbi:f-box domain-containing protein [Fusarium coicis]|nr:f-box domain-containing protein [Fusarium coicis]